MVNPTTKPKQRQFLVTLIHSHKHHAISHDEMQKALKLLLKHLRNRPPVKRAAPTADPITPAKKQAVVSLYRRNPSMLNRDIALRLNIDSGRVSEILAGKRY